MHWFEWGVVGVERRRAEQSRALSSLEEFSSLVCYSTGSMNQKAP
jgi:hypothetical protein